MPSGRKQKKGLSYTNRTNCRVVCLIVDTLARTVGRTKKRPEGVTGRLELAIVFLRYPSCSKERSKSIIFPTLIQLARKTRIKDRARIQAGPLLSPAPVDLFRLSFPAALTAPMNIEQF